MSVTHESFELKLVVGLFDRVVITECDSDTVINDLEYFCTHDQDGLLPYINILKTLEVGEYKVTGDAEITKFSDEPYSTIEYKNVEYKKL